MLSPGDRPELDQPLLRESYRTTNDENTTYLAARAKVLPRLNGTKDRLESTRLLGLIV